jgi:hypothetical protein
MKLARTMMAVGTLVIASCEAPGDDAAPAGAVPSVTNVCGGGRWQCQAQLVTGDHDRLAPPAGLGATDLQAAYKLTGLPSPAVTIAIVVAFNYPNVESDLAAYRAQFGLPACTKASGCLTIVNDNGTASPLPVNAPAGDDWTVEAAIDLDMASAACPSCKLLLVEAQDDQGLGLFASQLAATRAGAVVISDSWSGASAGLATDQDNDLSFFSHAGNVTTFAANGDAGGFGPPAYPSSSVKVVAVGSTTLKKSTTAARGWTETAAGAGACGIEAKPAFQVGVVSNSLCSKRTMVDVAAVGDPSSGVAAFNASVGGFIVAGGSSVSTPLVAAIYARAGVAATANHDAGYAYAHPCELFDITGVVAGPSTSLSKAGTGWDGPTGIGTPNGATLGRGTSCLSASPHGIER